MTGGHLGPGLTLALAVASAGCAGLWGFDDLAVGDAGGGDSSVDSSSGGSSGSSGSSGSGSSSGGGADSGSGSGGDAGECTSDADCRAIIGDAGGCVTSATCDQSTHACILDVCQSATACTASVCLTSSNTCTLPASYGFAPANFKVTFGGVGPAGPGVSIAAVWPFVFLATNNGIVAFNVVDPTSSAPPVVPVGGVPFLPNAAISVGRRVYFVTGPQGAGPTFHTPVAWIDVPQNPLLTSLQATSALLSGTTTSFNTVLSDGVDGLFFVYNATPLWPSANLHPPFSNLTSITTFPSINFPPNAQVLGASGTRLWTGRYDGINYRYFGALVTAAGTPSAQTTAEQPIGAGLGEIGGQAYRATGGDGSVLSSFAPYIVTDAGPAGIASACLTWLLDSSSAGNFDASKCWTLESYGSTAPSGVVVGWPGWIDANTALGLAGAASNPAVTTSVHVVKKSTGLVAGQVAFLPVGPTSAGVATSNGFGYALTQDDPMNKTCTVYVFAPACR